MRSPRGADPDVLDERPELLFGLVAGVGTPLELVQQLLSEELERFDYATVTIQLSELTKRFALSTPFPHASSSEADRIDAMMKRGNAARQVTGRNDILALAAIADVRVRRESDLVRLSGQAFILRQLKREDEVFLLRRTYGDGFHLLGIYCPRERRESYLRKKGMTEGEIAELIARDEHEPSDTGQDLRETFHLADAFIEVGDDDAELVKQIRRFLELLFGWRIQSPTRNEFGMFSAYGNALRSAQLGRQVGAAILGPDGDLLAVGTNEVPRFGGGVYWEDEDPDVRDHRQGRDSSDAMREEITRELTQSLTDGWSRLAESEQARQIEANRARIRSTTVAALTEFGRAVHAEAEAIVSAARLGIPVRGARLYCTTFPCHVCAKHIVSAGITEVTYIEPYAKSRASSLFEDSISVERCVPGRVFFRPFVGIAPRRFVDLFSMRTYAGDLIRRKDGTGKPVEGTRRMRLRIPYLSALDREKIAASELAEFSVEGEKR